MTTKNYRHYRPNVAAFIVDSKGNILLGRRPKEKAWQVPQGGIHRGETPEEALHRELKEETGLTDLVIETYTPNWLYYEFPLESLRKLKGAKARFIGQRQKYFMCRIPPGQEKQLQTSQEFDRFAFKQPLEVLDLIVAFKRPTYLKAMQTLGILPPQALL